jgi:hypothetical protein
VIVKTGSTKPDNNIGLMLDDEIVEKLRSAIEWLRSHRHLGVKEIAFASGVPEHTVRNFAYRRSNRPSNLVLGRLYRYFAEQGDLLPKDFVPALDTAASHSEDANPSFQARFFGLIHMQLPISEENPKRVYKRYGGCYLCFARLDPEASLSVSWLHIRPLNPTLDKSNDALPLPRFTWLLKSPDQVDPQTRRRLVGGYVVSRRGKLFLIGHHDGELQYLTLIEPRSRRFTFMHGLCLLTTPDGGAAIASRLVCQYLGATAVRSAWEEKIGIFPIDQIDRDFDHADAIKRALADNTAPITTSATGDPRQS